MRRYLVFAGDICYASGGMEDFVTDNDELANAIDAAEEALKGGLPRWAHIYDMQERKIVREW